MPGDPAWSQSAARLPQCGRDHGAARGSFDETARRVGHFELAAAELLVAEGHAVRSLPERRGNGPAPDFDVCGLLVEIKTLVPQAERPGGRPANDRSTYNRLLSGIDQAPTTILLAQGSGLCPADAAAGMQRFAARPRAGQTTAVRIVGDGWDLAWKAPVGLDRDGHLPPDRPGPDRGRAWPGPNDRLGSEEGRARPGDDARGHEHGGARPGAGNQPGHERGGARPGADDGPPGRPRPDRGHGPTGDRGIDPL